MLFALGGSATMVAAASYDGLFAQGEFRTIVRVVWIEALGRLPFVFLALWAGGMTAAAGAILATTVVFSVIPMTMALLRRLEAPASELRTLTRDVAAVVIAVTALVGATMAWAPVPLDWLSFAAIAATFLAAAAALAALVDRALVFSTYPVRSAVNWW